MKSEERIRFRELGDSLSKRNYNDIKEKLLALDLDGDSLIELLNHRSRRVGDTAFEALSRRADGPHVVIDAILSNRLTHRDAKVRGTNFLKWRGRSCPDAMPAYLHFLADKNPEVVHTALSGVVFLQDRAQIEELERRLNSLTAENESREAFERAIRALEQQDPFVFSPYFHDRGDVWKLDRKRFGDRIG